MIVGGTLNGGEKKTEKSVLHSWNLLVENKAIVVYLACQGKKIPGWNSGHIPCIGKEWFGLSLTLSFGVRRAVLSNDLSELFL